MAVTAAVPVVAQGLVSLAHGWYFLPNSLLLKASLLRAIRSTVQTGFFSLPGFKGFMKVFGYGTYEQFLRAPHVLFLLLLILVVELCRGRDRFSLARPSTVMIVLYAGATLLHMQFADVGWLFRYEAYLVGFGIFVLAVVLADWAVAGVRTPDLTAFATLLFVVFLSGYALMSRVAVAALTVPQAARNTYEQHYQMGLFLKQYFPGAKVTANDIGAINFLADIRCLDMNGLANRDTLALKTAGHLTREAMTALTRGSAVAILYERIFGPDWVPPGWSKVGSWKIPNNAIAEDPTVYFYSTEGNNPQDLAAKLLQFGSHMPSDIEQVILDSREHLAANR